MISLCNTKVIISISTCVPLKTLSISCIRWPAHKKYIWICAVRSSLPSASHSTKKDVLCPLYISNTVLGTKNSVNETHSDLQGAQVFGKVTEQMTRKGISIRGICGRELLELTQLNCFKGRSLEHRQIIKSHWEHYSIGLCSSLVPISPWQWSSSFQHSACPYFWLPLQKGLTYFLSFKNWWYFFYYIFSLVIGSLI